MRVLAFDTSNYTTSVASFDGTAGHNISRLLDVEQGALGLRQSDALFAHVKIACRSLPTGCFRISARTQALKQSASARGRAP